MLKRLLLFCGALAVLVHFSFDDQYHARLMRLEALMNAVLQHLGLDPDRVLAGPSEQVKYLIMQNKKIDAIKVYREQTGVDLKTAKDAVDALERQIRGY